MGQCKGHKSCFYGARLAHGGMERQSTDRDRLCLMAKCYRKSEGGWDVLVRLNGTLLEHKLRWKQGRVEMCARSSQAGASTCMKLACRRKAEEDWYIGHYQPKEGIFS